MEGLDADKCYFFRARVRTDKSIYGPDTYPSDWSDVAHLQNGELRGNVCRRCRSPGEGTGQHHTWGRGRASSMPRGEDRPAPCLGEGTGQHCAPGMRTGQHPRAHTTSIPPAEISGKTLLCLLLPPSCGRFLLFTSINSATMTSGIYGCPWTDIGADVQIEDTIDV